MTTFEHKPYRENPRLAGVSAIVVGVGFLLSGCVSAPHSTPVADLAETFSTLSPERATNDVPWWQSFRDSRLDALIRAGLARNLSIEEALAAVEEAQASARLTRASDLPGVEIAGAAERGTRDGAAVRDSTSATLSTSWLIDVFGRNRAERAAAIAELEASRFAVEVSRRAVASAVTEAYIDLRFYQESIALTRSSISSRRETLRLTESMMEVGQANRLDVLQAQQAVAQAEAGLPSLEIGFDQSLNRLATLTAARTADLRRDLQLGSAQPRARLRPGVGVPAEVMRARPDIRIAEHRLAAAAARVGVAEAAFWPSVTLSGNVSPVNFSGQGSQTNWGFGPQINLPIFSGGANTARLSAAESRAVQAEIQWRASVLNAVEEVENGLVAYGRGGRNVAAQSALVQSAEETVVLARESYASGQADFFTVLDAERNLLTARMALAGAIRDHAVAYVSLSLAAGSAI